MPLCLQGSIAWLVLTPRGQKPPTACLEITGNERQSERERDGGTEKDREKGGW